MQVAPRAHLSIRSVVTYETAGLFFPVGHVHEGFWRRRILPCEEHPNAAFRPHQSQPEGEPFRGRERRTRDRFVERALLERFTARLNDLHVGPPERADHRAQEGGPFLERLDQRDLEIRPEDRERQARGSRARSDVDDARVLADVLREDLGVGDEKIQHRLIRFGGGEVEPRVPRLEELQVRGECTLLRVVHRSTMVMGRPMPEVDFAPLRKLVGNGAVVEPMPGGASTRRYFRVEHQGKSAVAMFVPEGAKPEEIAKHAVHARWPFLEVRDLLAARGVDVPAIYAEDCDSGWLVLEDLGDDTLANFLSRSPGKKRELYTRAITDLARAQEQLSDLPEESIVRTRAFDEDLLRWEIDHFREWGLEARGITLGDEQRAIFDGIADRLAKKIAAWPRGFVHRDYQSRNLMVRPTESLCWIDFQDALLGPRIYDVVALLSDSYQEFDRQFVLDRLAEFAAGHGLSNADAAGLETEFDTMTVQRKLKDAGRFVFIDRVKNNASFLKFVVPTIHKVKASIARLDDPDMRALDRLLASVLPNDEWR